MNSHDSSANAQKTVPSEYVPPMSLHRFCEITGLSGSIVLSAQFSPDGQRVVTASGDKTAQVWDAASGKPIGDPMKHEGIVESAKFSPDGHRW
jgi:WD40 repeat protein